MADAVIDVLGRDELPQLVELYNQVYRPARTEETFRRRCLGRYNVLPLVARVKDRPVGFFLGFEQEPDVFVASAWGVLPDARRAGIGSQLLEAAHEWAGEHGYETLRLECPNRQQPMLHLALNLGYDIVGTRTDPDRGVTMVMLEKGLA
ncbi:MAG TPA: GNAT family N-acetyltransferase [Urbifossiella sp.]|jgi:GNAT superfamily N-acetyltransferase|nr:GNAT family N-acetyltransferase [Urbifossiella sp.]